MLQIKEIQVLRSPQTPIFEIIAEEQVAEINTGS
jgi:hypothetical protein